MKVELEEEETAENKIVEFGNVVEFDNTGCQIPQRCRILQFPKMLLT